MNSNENQIKRVCSFFVNEWHLTTMLLPYIHKKIEEKEEFVTILENGIRGNVEELMNRMNLKEDTKKEIANINWTSTKILKYAEIKKKIETVKNGPINILVNGDQGYINEVNKMISKVIKQSKTANQITVINCYEITKFSNISEITKEYEYILNTSGMQKVKEVFYQEETKEA